MAIAPIDREADAEREEHGRLEVDRRRERAPMQIRAGRPPAEHRTGGQQRAGSVGELPAPRDAVLQHDADIRPEVEELTPVALESNACDTTIAFESP